MLKNNQPSWWQSIYPFTRGRTARSTTTTNNHFLTPSLPPLVTWSPLLLLLTAILLTGCTTNPRQATQPDRGETVTAFMGDLAASATASGQISAQRVASLSITTPGRVAAVYVRVGDAVQAGDSLMQLETADLILNVTSAEQNLRLSEARLAALNEPPAAADIAAAEAGVASAQANLDDLKAGASPEEIAAAEANLRAAQANLSSATADLATVQASITTAQIEAAHAALLVAQLQQRNAQEANEDNPNEATDRALREANQAVAEAQAQLDALTTGPDQGQLGTAQGSVAAASARVQSSQADLSLAQAGPTAAQIAAAESQLAQAQATLVSLTKGPSDQEITTAEAEVEQARLALAEAQEALAQATLTAPFAGIVTAVHFQEGEIASGAALELVDPDSLEVVLQVDEVDVGQLTPGQPATLILAAWPDEPISSEIVAIAPSATTSTGTALVTYDVHLRLGQTDLPARIGMTADARLVTAQRQNVLLLPNRAIQANRSTGTYTVNLVQGDTVQEVTVQIGLRDDQHTQILSGLNVGDTVRIGNNLPVQTIGPGGGPFGGN